MTLLGCLVEFLFGGSPGAYGVLFLLLSALTALWVRRADLVTAPICVPLAFTAGAVPIADGNGFVARVMGVFTVLALHAGWLYAGTLVAALVVLVRGALLVARRAAAARAARTAARTGRPARPTDRAAGAAPPPARRSPSAPRPPHPAPQRAPGPRRRTV
jgi:hypothetical protein